MAKTTKKKTLTKKTAKAAAKTESKTAQEQLKLTAEPEENNSREGTGKTNNEKD